MKITWIDDDIEIIEPVIVPLVQQGHEITRFRTVRQALTSIEDLRTCALILLDMIVPMGDGREGGVYSGIWLLRQLREEYGIVTPVVVFSVVDPKKVEEQLAPLDVAAYVRKPALPNELKEVVDRVLGVKDNSSAGQ